jgi:hypothetical protein
LGWQLQEYFEVIATCAGDVCDEIEIPGLLCSSADASGGPITARGIERRPR